MHIQQCAPAFTFGPGLLHRVIFIFTVANVWRPTIVIGLISYFSLIAVACVREPLKPGLTYSSGLQFRRTIAQAIPASAPAHDVARHTVAPNLCLRKNKSLPSEKPMLANRPPTPWVLFDIPSTHGFPLLPGTQIPTTMCLPNHSVSLPPFTMITPTLQNRMNPHPHV